MDTTKIRRFGKQVRRFRERFVQSSGDALGGLLGPAELEEAVERHSAGRRDRIYPPVVTLGMFVDQVMSADQS